MNFFIVPYVISVVLKRPKKEISNEKKWKVLSPFFFLMAYWEIDYREKKRKGKLFFLSILHSVKCTDKQTDTLGIYALRMEIKAHDSLDM